MRYLQLIFLDIKAERIRMACCQTFVTYEEMSPGMFYYRFVGRTQFILVFQVCMLYYMLSLCPDTFG
jgi:hypothetical protein